MARLKSEDKRNAILTAAIAVFAQRGVGSTPTSAISKAAGVAEGTLFTYFATRDALINELYRALKLELAEVMLGSLPKSTTARSRFEHAWNGYVRWGVAHPDKYKVMRQLGVSENVSEESRAFGEAALSELQRRVKESIKLKQIRDYPVEFIGALFGSLAETTMGFVANAKRSRTDYCAAGFETFWRGIAAR